MKELTATATLATDNYLTILEESASAFENLLERLRQAESFAVDLETTSLNPMQAEIVGVSVSLTDHEAFYIPVDHRYLGVPRQLTAERVLGALAPFLKDAAKRKIGQNLKYDYQVLRRAGIELEGVWCDTMLASYLLNPVRSRS